MQILSILIPLLVFSIQHILLFSNAGSIDVSVSSYESTGSKGSKASEGSKGSKASEGSKGSKAGEGSKGSEADKSEGTPQGGKPTFHKADLHCGFALAYDVYESGSYVASHFLKTPHCDTTQGRGSLTLKEASSNHRLRWAITDHSCDEMVLRASLNDNQYKVASKDTKVDDGVGLDIYIHSHHFQYEHRHKKMLTLQSIDGGGIFGSSKQNQEYSYKIYISPWSLDMKFSNSMSGPPLSSMRYYNQFGFYLTKSNEYSYHTKNIKHKGAAMYVAAIRGGKAKFVLPVSNEADVTDKLEIYFDGCTFNKLDENGKLQKLLLECEVQGNGETIKFNMEKPVFSTISNSDFYEALSRRGRRSWIMKFKA